MSQQANVDTCKARVANRARAAEQGERMRVWINGLPVLGAPIAVGLAWLHPLLGAVGVASLTLGWLIAVYRTEILCQVTSGRLQDAEQALSHAQVALAHEHEAAGHEKAAAAPRSSSGGRARRGRPSHAPVRHH